MNNHAFYSVQRWLKPVVCGLLFIAEINASWAGIALDRTRLIITGDAPSIGTFSQSGLGISATAGVFLFLDLIDAKNVRRGQIEDADLLTERDAVERAYFAAPLMLWRIAAIAVGTTVVLGVMTMPDVPIYLALLAACVFVIVVMFQTTRHGRRAIAMVQEQSRKTWSLH